MNLPTSYTIIYPVVYTQRREGACSSVLVVSLYLERDWTLRWPWKNGFSVSGSAFSSL
jgi:hypothetical protein